MSIGRGRKEQTGLAQISPIHFPPSYSYRQAITRPLTKRQFEEGLGEPLFEGKISKIEIQMVKEVRNEALVFSLAPQNLASSCLLAL